MSWAETKSAINSTVGTANFKPLDKIVEDLVSKVTKTQAITINENGYYLPSEGYIGFSSVEVSVLATFPNISALAAGTVIPTGSQYQLTIEHGMGVTPNFYLLKAEDTGASLETTVASKSNTILALISYKMFAKQTLIYSQYNSSPQVSLDGNFNFVADNVSFKANTGYTSFKFLGGHKYHWLCGRFNEQ